MATVDEAKPVDTARKSAFEGLVFRLDKFKGIEPGGWSVDWKAILNRQVAVMIGLESKADGPDLSLTTEQALARIGYVKADGLSGLIEAARSALILIGNNHPLPGSEAVVDDLATAIKAVRDAAPAPVAEREGVRS